MAEPGLDGAARSSVRVVAVELIVDAENRAVFGLRYASLVNGLVICACALATPMAQSAIARSSVLRNMLSSLCFYEAQMRVTAFHVFTLWQLMQRAYYSARCAYFLYDL